MRLHLPPARRAIMPGMNTRPSPIPLRPDPTALNRADRQSFVRAVTAQALGEVRQCAPASILRTAWPNDSTAPLILRAATSPTTTADYRTATVVNPLVTLAPASAAAQLFAECFQVDLAGVTSVRLPYVTTTPQPGFIAEGAPAPAAQLSLSNVDIGPTRKLLILAGLSGELDNATPGTASAAIGKALSDACTKAVDAAAFDTAAESTTRPAGLLNGVASLTAAVAGGSDLETLAADLASLVNAIAAANINPEGLVLVASWKQALKLRLLAGSRFDTVIIGTSALADRTVVGVAPGGVGFGYNGTPEVTTSREATIHYESATPLAIGTAGTPPTIAAPTRSAFQTDTLILKVRARCAWAKIPGSVQVVTNTNW
jgi:hypothetical protein